MDRDGAIAVPFLGQPALWHFMTPKVGCYHRLTHSVDTTAEFLAILLCFTLHQLLLPVNMESALAARFRPPHFVVCHDNKLVTLPLQAQSSLRTGSSADEGQGKCCDMSALAVTLELFRQVIEQL